MKKYKGYIIPNNITKDFILGVITKGRCALSSFTAINIRCKEQPTCNGCLFNILNGGNKALIEYAIEEKYITKGEALKYTLDSIRISN